MHCHRQEHKEISTIKVKAKPCSLMDTKPKFVQICTICTTSSQYCLGKGPKSLLPLPSPSIYWFHIQHKLMLPHEKTEQHNYIYSKIRGYLIFKLKLNYCNFIWMNLILTIGNIKRMRNQFDAQAELLFTKPVFLFVCLVFFFAFSSPSFTKEDGPVSDRMYSMESRKMHFFAYIIIQKFSVGRPRPPSP